MQLSAEPATVTGTRTPRRVGQQIKVECIVPILKKRPLAPIAPLGDVMRVPRQDKSRKTRHPRRISSR